MTGTFEVEYVVQVRETLKLAEPVGDGEKGTDYVEAWRDIASVTVPARTKRRTVVEKGLEQAGIVKTPELEARLLDPAASYIWRAKPPEPASLRLS
jgi:hypothetical protein